MPEPLSNPANVSNLIQRLYKTTVVLLFESVDEIFKCDHLNES